MASVRRRPQGDAALPRLRRHVVRPGPTGDGDVYAQSLGTQSHRLRAQIGHRAQVPLAQLVGGKHPALGRFQLLAGVRQVDLHDLRGVEQALGVVVQPEDSRSGRSVVGAHALEDTYAVVQGVGQDVHLRLAPGNEFAVKPNPTVAVCEGFQGHAYRTGFVRSWRLAFPASGITPPTRPWCPHLAASHRSSRSELPTHPKGAQLPTCPTRGARAQTSNAPEGRAECARHYRQDP